MIKPVLATTALFAARALAQGSAVVVNHCDYEVYLANTPAQGNGFNAINQVLTAGGGSYSQAWTHLTTGGWSIKLARSKNFASNLMQYEYTYTPGSPLWFDLSDVNGNPWDADWEITATGDCSPKQQAYRFATDDAYGMQACPSDSTITVTLCSASGGSAPPPPSKHHHGHHHHHHPKPPPAPPA